LLIKVSGLHAYYGQSQVLHDVSVEVGKGESVCLIGRNGVGKTTLLRSLMGLVSRKAHQLQWDGLDVRKHIPSNMARLGLGYVPEDRGVFPTLTVAENLELGTISCRNGAPDFHSVYSLFPILKEREKQRAGTLSGGEQQMLSIARALLSRPQLLLIDEFSQGLSPTVVKEVARVIQQINRQGVAVLLVEQNVQLALQMTTRGYVMEKGKIVFSGTTADFHENTALLKKHLVI
jgi:branched-chain amino acid transport system ATP-binding protein